MKGLFCWVGFKQTGVPYPRSPRYSGRTKWSFGGLVDLAIEGFTSFTIGPLRLATISGFIVALMSFAYACVIIFKTIAHGDPVRGYPSLMTVVLFLGGVQLISLGVIGEYLGRMFNESKNRPLYLVQEELRSARDDSGDNDALAGGQPHSTSVTAR